MFVVLVMCGKHVCDVCVDGFGATLLVWYYSVKFEFVSNCPQFGQYETCNCEQ